MSTISNRFFVTAIEDGSTLHGNLRATKSLAQAWKQGQCEPDWTAATPIVEANQPVIFLSLMSGANYVQPDNGYTWEYNGNPMSFDASSHKNNAISGVLPANIFMTSTKTVGGVEMPALVIIGNVASSSNVDLDIITFRGSKTISTAPVPFSATTEIRISEWVNGGYMGVLTFEGGLTDITADNKSVTIIPSLYNDNGLIPATEGQGASAVQNWTVRWFLNDQEADTDSTKSFYIDNDLSLVVTEPAVTDYATARCEFYTVDGQTNTLVFTAYEGIDDTQDPEYMYVAYAANQNDNSQSGNAASLHPNESVTFNIWIGTMTDPTPSSGWTYKVKLLTAQGTAYTTNISDQDSAIPNVDSGSEYRTLPVDNTTHKASIKISYNVVNTLGKALTGLIQATSNS